MTWSLAIEEQFYLVWPLVVALTSRRALLWTCVALMAAALAVRVWLLAAGAHWILPYVLPMCRIDALAAGALGVSISGSGPTVFAVCDSQSSAASVAKAMNEASSRNSPSRPAFATPARRRHRNNEEASPATRHRPSHS